MLFSVGAPNVSIRTFVLSSVTFTHVPFCVNESSAYSSPKDNRVPPRDALTWVSFLRSKIISLFGPSIRPKFNHENDYGFHLPGSSTSWRQINEGAIKSKSSFFAGVVIKASGWAVRSLYRIAADIKLSGSIYYIVVYSSNLLRLKSTVVWWWIYSQLWGIFKTKLWLYFTLRK